MTHRVGIDSEDVLVERRVDTNHIAHLVIDLQLERSHRSVEVDSIEVLHEENLTVTLSTVARLRPLRGLADLDDDNVPAERSTTLFTCMCGCWNTHGTTWPSNSYKPEYTLP